MSVCDEGSTIRLRFDLAYDGTFFRGWASQPGLRTCQGELERALETIARCPVRVTVAGRTDAGVHASHQVVHCDFPVERWGSLLREPWPAPVHLVVAALVRRLNALLSRQCAQWMGERGLSAPKGVADLVVSSVAVVSEDFDARFSALGRRYAYRVGVGQVQPLRRHDVYWVGQGLDVAAMRQAALPLLGEHDFLSFCKPREGATTIRRLTRLDVEEVGGGEIVFRVEADAFCHSMVRSLVGALLEVGRGGDVQVPGMLLAARSRDAAAPIAPAHGLTLAGVDYPEVGQWAVQARRARRRRDEELCCGEGEEYATAE